MFSSNKLWTFALILSITRQAITLRSFDIRWTKANCTTMSPIHVSHFVCPMEELPRNRGNFLTAEVRFSRPIDNLVLEIRVYMPVGQNNDVELLKFRANGCIISKYQSRNPVVNALVKQLLQAGNFPKMCPLQQDFNYTVRHLSLNPDFFPGFTPEMNFSAKFDLFTDKILMLSASVEANLFKKK